MNLNELDEAINDFKKVVLIEPTNQAASNRMTECLQQKIKEKKQSQEINNNKQSQGATKQNLEVKKQEMINMGSGWPKGVPAFIGATGATGDTGPMGAMRVMGAMSSHDMTNMREFVDYFYQNPSKLQEMQEVREIPDFVTEYMNKYGKNDFRRLFHLITAYIGFCSTSSKSLDEQVDSV